MLEFRLGIAELDQADLASGQFLVSGFEQEFVIDVTPGLVLFEPDLERVPVAWPVVAAFDVPEDLPGENIRAIKACEAKPAAGGIKAVMFVAAVRVPGQSRRPR